MKMIKNLLLMLLVGISVAAVADSFTNEVGGNGGSMLLRNRKVVGLGNKAGMTSALTIPFVTDINLTQGQPVVMTSDTTNGVSVSGTTTVADKAVVGVVTFPEGTTSATAGSIVQIAVRGVALAHVGQDITKGDVLCTSGTATKLTKVAAASEGIATQVSRTAVIGMALETKSAVAGDGYVRILIK